MTSVAKCLSLAKNVLKKKAAIEVFYASAQFQREVSIPGRFNGGL
jgi:hypothetical protein